MQAHPAPRSLHPVGRLPRHDRLGSTTARPVSAGERVEAGDCESIRPHLPPVPRDVGTRISATGFGGTPFVEPVKARHLGEVANAIARRCSRGGLHSSPGRSLAQLPSSYAPMPQFKVVRPYTEIYLGLIHAADGVEGTKKRIALAHEYVNLILA